MDNVVSKIPQLSKEQRLQNLQSAYRARKKRADFKSTIFKGAYSLEEALHVAEEDDILSRIYVKDFLSSFCGIGPVKVTKIMKDIGISEHRRISGLGCRQKQVLIRDFNYL